MVSSLVLVGEILVVSLVVIKLYLKLTTGICKSYKRMNGKTVIVTGANTGIGKETARDMVQRGARVIMACRNVEKGKQAQNEIIGSTKKTDVIVKKLDLDSLSSVREFAEDILKTEPQLDVLVNNAGMSLMEYQLTGDGLEVSMQSNHFGHFLLTNLLLELLKKSAPSRIVVVSSVGHKFATLQLDNLNMEKKKDIYRQYPNTKLANILFSNELARRLEGTGVTVNSLHPGAVATEFFRNVNFKLLRFLFKTLFKLFLKDSTEGAQTSIYLAVSEEVEGVSGKYFSDCKEASTSREAKDKELARKLWEKSEIAVGLKQKEN